jgi:LuxR family transcriptional regulator, regulator of acetate metabolism
MPEAPADAEEETRTLVESALGSARAAVAGEGGIASSDELQAASTSLQLALGALGERLDARAAGGPPRRGELWALLSDLHQLERELVERRYVRRVDALERVGDAVRRLGEVGSPAGILARAAEELGTSSEFDRVLMGRIRDDRVETDAVWVRDDPSGAAAALEALRAEPMRLRYPLIEAEVVRQGSAAVVVVADAAGRVDRRLAEVLAPRSYVVAPLVLDGKAVGLFHADCALSERDVDPLDREVLAAYVDGMGQVFERAVLRERLRRHREELRGAVQWLGARAGVAPEDGLPVGDERVGDAPSLSPGGQALGDVGGGERLTPRELDVLRLMARGNTNNAIAEALVVSEGTVKFHVKNVLRKLQATNRADAVARYLRMSAPQEDA